MRLFRSTLIALLLTLALSIGCFASSAGAAMPLEETEALLNAEELHPQCTGYLELDVLIAQLLEPYAQEDAYTQLKAAYNWLVSEVNYSWAQYSQDWAPAYDCFVPVYIFTTLSFVEPTVPYEIANRTYHTLLYREGICYDFGAAFAVIARYVGVEAYVRTGDFVFERQFGNGSSHHGWAVLVLDGAEYIFDPQRDYRLADNGEGENPYDYFGIAPENTWRYTPEEEVNRARDAQFQAADTREAVLLGQCEEPSLSETVAYIAIYLSTLFKRAAALL